jgi:uncharacterized OsmC-like protein
MAVKSVRVKAHSSSASLSSVQNDRGRSVDAVFSPRADGFTPLELQAAALAACIDASVRLAARQEGAGSIGGLEVEVIASKAEDLPSRLDDFEVIVTFNDPLDGDAKNRLVEAAEAICTISNTLRSGEAKVHARRY